MDMGFGTAVGRYIGVALGRGDHQAVREYWATGNALALPLLGVMAGIFIGLGVLLGPKWFQVADESLLRWCFVAGGLGLFLSYYTLFWTVLSQAHLDFKFISVLRTIISLAGPAANARLISATNASVAASSASSEKIMSLEHFSSPKWRCGPKPRQGFS